MNFAGLVERIRLNLGIGNDEICQRLRISTVTLENYLSGYARPPAAIVQRLFADFSVLSDAVVGESLLPNIPAETIDLNELVESVAVGRRFAVSVKDDLLADSGVFNGSYAVMELGHESRPGDIILASVDGGKSLLYLYNEDGGTISISRGETVVHMNRNEFDQRVRPVGKLVCTLENVNKDQR